jgi:hypothetical protein
MSDQGGGYAKSMQANGQKSTFATRAAPEEIGKGPPPPQKFVPRRLLDGWLHLLFEQPRDTISRASIGLAGNAESGPHFVHAWAPNCTWLFSCQAGGPVSAHCTARSRQDWAKNGRRRKRPTDSPGCQPFRDQPDRACWSPLVRPASQEAAQLFRSHPRRSAVQSRTG